MTCAVRRIVLVFLGLILLAGFLSAQPPVRSKMRSRRQPSGQKTAPKPFILPAIASGPLQQVPMSDLPATPPQVSYRSGLLTIVAQNATLGDILREIHKQTGAIIDVPSNANERVATRLGPGPARDVLADLLNGSTFNYVIVGTAADPATLANVVLTPKPAGTPTLAAAFQPPPQYIPPQQAVQIVPAPGMGPGGQVAQQADSDDDSDTAEEEPEENAEDQGQSSSQNTVAPDGTQQPNGGPRTPEQILEMLRQRQQQAPGQMPVQRLPNPQPPPQQQPDE